MSEFGQRLQAARERAGLSAYALARRTGVNEETIRRVERGESDPQLSTALLLAAGVGESLADLAGPPPELPNVPTPKRGRRPKARE